MRKERGCPPLALLSPATDKQAAFLSKTETEGPGQGGACHVCCLREVGFLTADFMSLTEVLHKFLSP